MGRAPEGSLSWQCFWTTCRCDQETLSPPSQDLEAMGQTIEPYRPSKALQRFCRAC